MLIDSHSLSGQVSVFRVRVVQEAQLLWKKIGTLNRHSSPYAQSSSRRYGASQISQSCEVVTQYADG